MGFYSRTTQIPDADALHIHDIVVLVTKEQAQMKNRKQNNGGTMLPKNNLRTQQRKVAFLISKSSP
jgi:hypothetical protein